MSLHACINFNELGSGWGHLFGGNLLKSLLMGLGTDGSN